MSAFTAVLRHTITTLLKSPSYLIAGFLNLAIAIFMPIVMISGGDVVMQFQLAIGYTLGIISMLIFMCCIWSSCSLIARDIDSYKLHMIISKPVHRGSFWVGRFLGVAIAYIFILIISLIFLYGSLRLMPEIKGLNKFEISDLNQNIYISKKTYLSLQENLSQEIDKEVESKLQIAKKENQTLSKDEVSDLRKRTYYSVLSMRGEVKGGSSKEFNFELLKSSYQNGTYLTFTPYVGAIDVLEKQKRDSISGDFFLKVNDGDFVKINDLPQRLVSNEKYSVKLPEIILTLDVNKLILKFTNSDRGNSVFFRLNENPQILVSYCSFFENYLRVASVMIIGLILMSAIGCALGGFLSFPIAIFVILFYLIFGSLSSYILSDSELYKNTKALDMKIGYSLSKTLVKVVSPIQSFQPTDEISSGNLLESSAIFEIVKKYFAIQIVVFVLGGIYLFSRREFGMVIKK